MRGCLEVVTFKAAPKMDTPSDLLAERSQELNANDFIYKAFVNQPDELKSLVVLA